MSYTLASNTKYKIRQMRLAVKHCFWRRNYLCFARKRDRVPPETLIPLLETISRISLIPQPFKFKPSLVSNGCIL